MGIKFKMPRFIDIIAIMRKNESIPSWPAFDAMCPINMGPPSDFVDTCPWNIRTIETTSIVDAFTVISTDVDAANDIRSPTVFVNFSGMTYVVR